MTLQDLHHLGKVQERAAEAIDLLNHYTVDFASLDVAEQLGESRPVHIAAAVAAIVIAGGQRHPTGMLLAVDVGQGSFALGIQTGEGLVQAFVGGLAGIKGTADGRRRGAGRCRLGHEAAPLGLRRKNKKPLQCEPVMALATADRER